MVIRVVKRGSLGWLISGYLFIYSSATNRNANKLSNMGKA